MSRLFDRCRWCRERARCSAVAVTLLNDIAMSRRSIAAIVVVGPNWGRFASLVPPINAQIGALDALYGTLMLVASLAEPVALAAMWLAPLASRALGRWAMVASCLAFGVGFAKAGWMTTPVTSVLAIFFCHVRVRGSGCVVHCRVLRHRGAFGTGADESQSQDLFLFFCRSPP